MKSTNEEQITASHDNDGLRLVGACYPSSELTAECEIARTDGLRIIDEGVSLKSVL
jgi:hypothetical protein